MREPDITGDGTRAWRIRRTEAAREQHVREWGFEDTTIDTWIVNGPFHPFWSWWSVAVVHLRDVPGAAPPNKSYPEAEYEFMVVSMNPDPDDGRPKTPDIDRFEETGDAMKYLPGFLMPPDVITQFDGVTDEQARQVCEHAARAIIGGVSCDSDFREWWEEAIRNTVEHIRLGGHPAVVVGPS